MELCTKTTGSRSAPALGKAGLLTFGPGSPLPRVARLRARTWRADRLDRHNASAVARNSIRDAPHPQRRARRGAAREGRVGGGAGGDRRTIARARAPAPTPTLPFLRFRASPGGARGAWTRKGTERRKEAVKKSFAASLACLLRLRGARAQCASQDLIAWLPAAQRRARTASPEGIGAEARCAGLRRDRGDMELGSHRPLGVPEARWETLRAMPKVELHAHLNGSVRLSTLRWVSGRRRRRRGADGDPRGRSVARALRRHHLLHGRRAAPR